MFATLLAAALSCPGDPPAKAPDGLSGMIAEAARRQKTCDDREKVEYARAVQLAHATWQADQFSRVRELLDGIPQQPRGWEWFYYSPKK
jgi:hypothetical protein